MVHVAKHFTPEEGQKTYLAKAEEFRMPFWGQYFHAHHRFALD